MNDVRWTQPICGDCYSRENPGREPVRVLLREEEQCVHCGVVTAEGIYTRIDPDYARYPTLRKEQPMSENVTIIECDSMPKKDYLGNSAERTDEKIETIARKFLRRSAVKFAKRSRPLTPFYHLRVEKVDGRWEVNVYQNKLVPNEPDHPRG